MKEIGKELERYFDEKGIKQREIADKVGVSPSYITKLFGGERNFGRKMAMKFETHFGLSHAFLMTGEGDIEIKPSRAEATNDVPFFVYKELLDRYEAVLRENEQLKLRLAAANPSEKRNAG